MPEGHYAEANMKATVVPNRNMIMISIATGIAVAEDALGVYTGVHAGDHFVYPDCRPKFIDAVNGAVVEGNEGFGRIPINDDSPSWLDFNFVFAPYLYFTKAEIASTAIALGVPLEDTWSCYKGGDKHCGVCGTCVERLEAIDIAEGAISERVDHTEYEDDITWKQLLANAPK